MRKVSATATPTRPIEVYRLPNGFAVRGHWHDDPKSPDKRRFKAATPREFSRVVEFLRNDAAGMCEKCPRPHFIGKYGHPHHDRHSKMGSGFRDDRYIVCGERQIFYVCQQWHDDHHSGRHHAKAVSS